MMMKKIILTLIILSFAFYTIGYSQPDRSKSGAQTIKMRVGINNSWIFGSPEFGSGVSGRGLAIEGSVYSNFYLALMYNTLQLQRKPSPESSFPFHSFETREVFAVLKYRLERDKTSIFLGAGIGDWLGGGPAGMFTLGMDYRFFKKISGGISLERLKINSVDYGRRSWDLGYWNIRVNLAYNFQIKPKK